MKFVRIDPPGTWCQNEAILSLIQSTRAKTFVEVGCGGGDLSYKICDLGLKGIGLDFSPSAIEIAQGRLEPFLKSGRYQLMQADATSTNVGPLPEPRSSDLGLSIMVMEHVEDDLKFIQDLARLVKVGGHVLIGVPGRRDKWNIEDETVGHLRRYDRVDLKLKMEAAGLIDIRVISISVPIANFLFYIGNFLIKRSSEVHKKDLSLREQTETSGIREIPFKTVFPVFFRLFLNRFTMYPLFVLQRLFYNSDLGLTILGIGKVPTQASSNSGAGFKEEYFDDLFSAEADNFWFRGRNRFILWGLQKFAPGFSRFLEIGCGTGYVLKAVAEAYPNREIVGSELFEAGLKHAAKRLPATVKLMQMDARKVPFGADFDVVGAFDVVEHIEEDEIVLKEVNRILKKDGHLLLTVPQHPWLWSRSDSYAEHRRRYSESDLHDKLKRAGFEVRLSTSFVTLLMPALIISRLVDRVRPAADYDPMREMVLPRMLNWIFESTLNLEFLLVKMGIRLPIGGTRFVVAKKCD